MNLDLHNYYNDRRVSSGVARKPTVLIENEDGECTEEELPFLWQVCPVCNGNGTHVNPAIDSGGISMEDFEEDPDFAEAYVRGDYDITCNHCQGLRVVPAVDVMQCDPDLLELWEAQEADEAEFKAVQRAELSMGA